jgi:transposase
MRKFSHNYPSDITREQFEKIRTDLEGAKQKTKPRDIDLYHIFCAIMYLLKSGCQWRMLPSDFPKWGIVRYYYDVWSKKTNENEPTVLEGVLKKIGAKSSE